MVGIPTIKGKKFIISTKSEDELLKSSTKNIQRLLIGAIVCFVIGAAIMVFGVVR